MKIAVIGSGSWGTALANVLANNMHDVIIWGKSEKEILDIKENHQNSLYFEGVDLNPALKASPDFNDIVDYDIFLLAVPSIAIEEVCQRLNKSIDKKVTIINVAK